MKTAHEKLVQIFEDWETDYRADPQGFMSREEVAMLETGTLAECRAVTFTAYLRQQEPKQ